MAHSARHVGRVVDQIVWPRGMATMVEELDPQVPINREHPITDLMNLMKHGTLVCRQAQRHNRARMRQVLTASNCRHCDRDSTGNTTHEVGSPLSSLQRLRRAMKRTTQPSDGLL